METGLTLSPLANSVENEISLYIITTCWNIQVMRVKEEITKDKMFRHVDKFSLLVP